MIQNPFARGSAPYDGLWIFKLQNLVYTHGLNQGFNIIHVPTIQPVTTFTTRWEKIQHMCYSFQDKSNRLLLLRPEVTAQLCSYVATLTPGRYYFMYNENCFRYERPCQHRKREFRQLGVEIISHRPISFSDKLISLSLLAHTLMHVEGALRINILDKRTWILILKEFKKNISAHKLSSTFISNFHLRGVKNAFDNLNQHDIIFIDAWWLTEEDNIMLSLAQLIFKQKVIFTPTLIRGWSYYKGFVYEVHNIKGVALAGGGDYYIGSNYGTGWAIGASRMLSGLYTLPPIVTNIVKICINSYLNYFIGNRVMRILQLCNSWGIAYIFVKYLTGQGLEINIMARAIKFTKRY